ncbi:MAG: c-type cytochrome [Burkholderiaceae bacterium]
MTRVFALSAVLTFVLISPATSALAEDASQTAVAKADTTKGGAIAQAVCSACHGPDGNATGPTFPKLAGQHVSYLTKELHNFKVVPGATEPARYNPIMNGYAAALSDTDIANVAAYYAGQVYKPASAKIKDSVVLGQKIWRGGIAERGVPACAACHGPTGAGIPVQYPRLQGQWGEYNEAQLTAFKGGVRKNNAAMMMIASRLSEAEMKAVADYAAGLR